MNHAQKYGFIKMYPSACSSGGFSGHKTRPERFSTMNDLLDHYKGNSNHRMIITVAKEIGAKLTNLGKSTEDICDGIDGAALRLGRRDKGYKSAMHAVASLVLAKNDSDTAIALIDNMAGMLRGENRTHLRNISDMMKTAKSFGLNIETLGGGRPEITADEILRVAVHPRYKTPENGVAIVALAQKAPGAADMVKEKILPGRSGSELYCLGSYVKNLVNKQKMRAEDARPLLDEIKVRLAACLPGSQ